MDLKNKKIGIWGFGIVGKSVFNYVKKYTDYVQVLDQKMHPDLFTILQTPESIEKFFQENDYIIPSPGIVLHKYEQKYRHKIVCELDLFTPNYNHPVIAITGTAGKTTVTDFITQSIPHSIAAGNIGLAMLDVLKIDPQPTTAVLELSSYQLQYANNFAPDIAIWTNFFANHLDHHTDIQEYFLAKYSILKHQTKNQKALVHHSVAQELVHQKLPYQGQLYTYTVDEPISKNNFATFYRKDNEIILSDQDTKKVIFKNFDQLPNTTFSENWIAIIACLYLANKDLSQLKFNHCKLQPHRVEYVATYNNLAIYNDSKATIQESTLQALQLFKDKKIALILGGLSKGADRQKLIQHIANQKNITPFIFGQEEHELVDFCKKYNVKYFNAHYLEDIFKLCMQHHTDFDLLLFSPAGSSFDQFKNYQDRGEQFKKLVLKEV